MKSRPLNRLDARLLGLQRGGRPWAISLRALMTEPVPRSAVASAVGRLASVSPDWTARIGGADPRRPEWILDRGALPSIHGTHDPELLDRRFDLRNEGPVRISVETSGDGTVIGLAVNHAFADGRGTLLLMRNLLTALADRPCGRAPVVSDDDLALLPPGGVGPRARVTAALLRQSVRRVATLDIDERAPTAMACGPLDMTGIDALRVAEPGLSVNDVLVAAVHRALGRMASSSRPVVVGVPVDLRRRFGGADSLGNAVLSATTISAGAGDAGLRAESSRHGTAIRDQTTATWLGAQLAVSTMFARPGKSDARPPVRRRGWPQTAVCSNLGVVEDHPGWSGVRSIEFAPPAHQIAAIGIATLGSTTTLTVRSRSSPADARALLGEIVDQLT